MKNNEFIQIAALVVIAAALLYRKYGKKNKASGTNENGISGTTSQSTDDEYEPYSKKNNGK